MNSHDTFPPPQRISEQQRRHRQHRRDSNDTADAIYYRDSQINLNAIAGNNNTQDDASESTEEHNNTLAAMREMRISEGLCPTCGVQLFKKEKPKKKNKLLPSRKNRSGDESKDNEENNTPRMIPLDVEGVVARGQCVRCASGEGEAAIMASAHAYGGSSVVGRSSVVTDVASVRTAVAQPDMSDGVYRPTAAVRPCPPALSSSRRRHPTPPPPRPPPPQVEPQVVEQKVEEGGGEENGTPVCPEGMDPSIFSSLPLDLQRELAADYEAEQRLLHPTTPAAAPTTTTTTTRPNPPPTTAVTRPQTTTGRGPSINPQEVIAVPVINENEAVIPSSSASTAPQVLMSCTYEGPFNENRQRHGEGTLKWQNGDVYKGSFFNNKRQGNGTLTFADGTEYVGVWEDDLMHGDGTRRFPNGNVYTGSYIYGKRSGQGRCYFANGDLYTGEFRNDTMYGHGRYYYNTGQSFEGNFLDGKRHGRGKFQFRDGHVEIFRYCEDQRVGEGVRWSKDRKKAWRLKENGKVKGKVGIEEAARIADECGPLREPV